MGQLVNFKRQHREIRELVNKIKSSLLIDLLQTEPASVRYILSTLSGKLLMHLAMEDQFLYPSLMEKNDPILRATAQKFLTEMGDLVDVFKNYSQKWLRPSLIQADPRAFIEDSNQIFHALLQRIDQEDQELYPLSEEAK